MGNDNKVNKSLDRRTDIFFNESGVIKVEKPDLYSLEDEFAKTKSKRHLFVFLGALFFVGILVGIVLLISDRVKQRNSEIEIDVSDFYDLNLTDILQSTKNDESRLRSLIHEVADLRGNWQLDRRRTIERYATERQIAGYRYLDAAGLEQELARLRQSEYNELVQLDARYQTEINEKQTEINQITKRLEAQNKEIDPSAQTALGSQMQLIEIERGKVEEGWRRRLDSEQRRYRTDADEQRRLQRKTAETLIMRYNPVFSEPAILPLLSDGGQLINPAAQFDWRASLAREAVLDEAGFSALRENIKDERLLLERLHAIQYTNSVSKAILGLGLKQATIISTYENLWHSLVNRVEQKNSRLAAYNKAFATMMKDSREHGYILDTSSEDSWPVVVDSRYQVQAGDLAYVIRGENTQIGSVRFAKTLDGLIAIPLGDFSERPVAMDKLLLQLR